MLRYVAYSRDPEELLCTWAELLARADYSSLTLLPCGRRQGRREPSRVWNSPHLRAPLPPPKPENKTDSGNDGPPPEMLEQRTPEILRRKPALDNTASLVPPHRG